MRAVESYSGFFCWLLSAHVQKKLLEAKQGTRGKGKRNRIQKEKRIQFPDLKQIQE